MSFLRICIVTSGRLIFSKDNHFCKVCDYAGNLAGEIDCSFDVTVKIIIKLRIFTITYSWFIVMKNKDLCKKCGHAAHQVREILLWIWHWKSSFKDWESALSVVTSSRIILRTIFYARCVAMLQVLQETLIFLLMGQWKISFQDFNVTSTGWWKKEGQWHQQDVWLCCPALPDRFRRFGPYLR